MYYVLEEFSIHYHQYNVGYKKEHNDIADSVCRDSLKIRIAVSSVASPDMVEQEL